MIYNDSFIFDDDIARLAETGEHNHDEVHHYLSINFHSFVILHDSLTFDYEIARITKTGEHNHDKLHNFRSKKSHSFMMIQLLHYDITNIIMANIIINFSKEKHEHSFVMSYNNSLHHNSRLDIEILSTKTIMINSQLLVEDACIIKKIISRN